MTHPAIATRVRRPDGDRSRRAALVTLGCGGLLVLAALASLGTGPTGVGPADLWTALSAGPEALDLRARVVLFDVRLPRLLLAILVGGGLALSGAMMQGLFRNPLADPGLVGISNGAAAAAVAAMVLGSGPLAGLAVALGSHFVPLAAFSGALVATVLLYGLATREGRTATATLILAGIAVSAFAGAVTGLFLFAADDAALRDFTFWSLGSLGGATMAKVAAVAPFTALAVIAVPFVARGLDALVLGEAEALHLGVPVETMKRVVIVAVAAAAGAAVAVTGVIGFVGIVVPHLLRLVIGPGHRALLPASALGGAALLIGADALCRVVVAPAELPIGIVMALIGVPVFLAVLLSRRAFGGA